MPVDFFLPSRESASTIDRDIRSGLASSLLWCAEHAGASEARLALPDDWNARPVDFGCYFDLLVMLSTAGPLDADRANHLLARVRASVRDDTAAHKSVLLGNAGFRITTLRRPWYGPEEVDCLVRWFDIEPDNGMSLTALDDAELEDASGKLKQAIEAIEVLLPDFMGEMSAITSEIIFAKPSGEQKLTFGGASSFSLWGAIALNPAVHEHWWQYIPRLVHEYSHNLLFGIARNEPLLLNDPQERYMSPLRQEHRPLDGIFHAMFVTAREVLASREILRRFDEAEALSGIGGLKEFFEQTEKDSKRSYEDCLSVVERYGKPSQIGQDVLRDTVRAMNVATSISI